MPKPWKPLVASAFISDEQRAYEEDAKRTREARARELKIAGANRRYPAWAATMAREMRAATPPATYAEIAAAVEARCGMRPGSTAIRHWLDDGTLRKRSRGYAARYRQRKGYDFKMHGPKRTEGWRAAFFRELHAAGLDARGIVAAGSVVLEEPPTLREVNRAIRSV